MDDDRFFMKEALKEAKRAYQKKEVPAGAVVVLENQIMARAHNLVETRQDATCHAEILAIQEASKILGNFRLSEAILYTTLEPCAMCYGAALLSRIKKIVYAAKDFRHGVLGGWVNLADSKHPIHNLEYLGGILAEESSALLKQFFIEVRRDKS